MREEKKRRCSGLEVRVLVIFRERVSHFSLRFREIGPSDSFGARRKAVLCVEGNAWAPVSWSFKKLCELGVLSYLSYTLFKCFVDG